MVGSEQNGNVDGLTSSPSKLLEATWKGIPASRGPCPAPAMVLLRPSPHSLQIQRLSPPLQWLFGKTPRQDVLGRIRVPAPRVLTEAAQAQGEVLQTEAVPQGGRHALVVNLPVLVAQRHCLDRNPTQCALRTVRNTPAQFGFFELTPTGAVLF